MSPEERKKADDKAAEDKKKLEAEQKKADDKAAEEKKKVGRPPTG